MSESPRVSLRYFTGTGNSKRVDDLCAAAFAEAGWKQDIAAIPNGGPPAAKATAAILASGESKATAAARTFIAGERFEKALHLMKFGPLGSGLMRLSFKLGVKRLWSKFRTNDDCTSCGLCAGSCPTGSIVMDGGHPRWSKSCEQCMRCFNICPSRAILQLESIGKGSTRERWIEPHFQP